MPHPDLLVERLRPEQVLVVYPLIRAVDPAVSLQEWVRYARRVGGQRSGRCGVLVARRGKHRFPSGLVCYRMERRVFVGAVLVSEYFAVLDLLSPELIVAALVRGLDQLAVALRCRRVQFVCDSRETHIASSLKALGIRPEAVLLSRLDA